MPTDTGFNPAPRVGSILKLIEGHIKDMQEITENGKKNGYVVLSRYHRLGVGLMYPNKPSVKMVNIVAFPRVAFFATREQAQEAADYYNAKEKESAGLYNMDVYTADAGVRYMLRQIEKEVRGYLEDVLYLVRPKLRED